MVDAAGGGVLVEEAGATAERLLGGIRRILTDERLRRMMGEQIRALSCADAAARLGEAIVALAGKNDFTDSQSNNVPAKPISPIKRSIGEIRSEAVGSGANRRNPSQQALSQDA